MSNKDRLKGLLDEYDKEKDAQEAMQTAGEMGKAANEGDIEKLAELSDKAKRKGWVK